MNRAEITDIQKRIGTTPDGFWGPASIAACQRHLRALMPSPNPWPSTDQASLTRFYGSPGDWIQHRFLDVTAIGIHYEGKLVSSIRCHRKIADSLHRVLINIAPTHPEILAEYAGCYNDRPMRGGTTPSLHARAAAIDFDPDNNQNRQSWPVSATMPLKVMEAFAREGWLAAGAFWGRDAMHFQATQ